MTRILDKQLQILTHNKLPRWATSSQIHCTVTNTNYGTCMISTWYNNSAMSRQIANEHNNLYRKHVETAAATRDAHLNNLQNTINIL